MKGSGKQRNAAFLGGEEQTGLVSAGGEEADGEAAEPEGGLAVVAGFDGS
jgi:hypothetical protein